MSTEYCLTMSEARKKNPSRYWLGKSRSQKTKDKIREALKGDKSNFWVDGRSFEPYTDEFNNQLKELIRLRDGYKCQRCGCPEIEQSRRLSVHHIDYDKKNCKPNNLIALCVGCNSKVNLNRKYWTDYFQRKIKEVTDSNKAQLSLRFASSNNKKNQNKEVNENVKVLRV